jgi:hypothetical protein
LVLTHLSTFQPTLWFQVFLNVRDAHKKETEDIEPTKAMNST